MDANQEKYVSKIQKLLRLAEDPRTPQNEAEQAYQKAQELITRWAIDDAMLAAATGGKPTESIDHEEFVIVGIYRFPLADLTAAVLRNNGLRPIIIPDAGWREVGGRVFKETYVMKAVGFSGDMKRARMLEQSLHMQALRAENEWWRENEHLYSYMKKGEQHRARRGFLFGFARGVDIKLKEANLRAQTAAAEQHGTGMELVLRDKGTMVAERFKELYPATRSSRDRRDHGDAYAQSKGVEAGRRADVGHDRIGGNAKKKQLT